MISNAKINLSFYLHQIEAALDTLEYQSWFDLAHVRTAEQLRTKPILEGLAYSARMAKAGLQEYKAYVKRLK